MVEKMNVDSKQEKRLSSTISPDALDVFGKEIENLMKKDLKPNDCWYLVDAHWFKQFQRYTSGTDPDTGHQLKEGSGNLNPGPIDNLPLLQRDTVTGETSLKADLLEVLNYVLLPESAWQKLSEAFGVCPGQLEIARRVIESGMFVKQTKIEIYPLEIFVCLSSNEDVKRKIVLSRTKTNNDLLSKIRETFSIADDAEFRIFIKHAGESCELFNINISNGKTSLQDSGLYSNQVIIFDVQSADGKWNVEDKRFTVVSTTSDENRQPLIAANKPSSTGSMSSSSTMDYYDQPTSNHSGLGRKTEIPGLCGLSNLGNTCFMNSGLQCMSNTPPLTDYFLSGRYEGEINEANPLGMHGEMARAFAELIKQIWSSKSGAVIPRSFKTNVGRFAPQFSGYQQQDSQELLAFLLDGLHEDLNRVRNKPYVEIKDSDGKPDAEAAQEAWRLYKLRNDSIIVDLFHGLLKSTLVCPDCQKVSVTFDPFCYLSLPLPLKKERQVVVTFVPLDNKLPLLKCKVTTQKNGTIIDLSEGLGRMIGVNPETLIFADVYSNRVHKFFYTGDSLSTIMEKDEIYAYQVEQFTPEENGILVCVYNRMTPKKRPFSSFSSSSSLIGVPMVVMVKKENVNYNGLLEAAKFAVDRFVENWPEDDSWCESDSGDDSGVDENDDSNQTEEDAMKNDPAARTRRKPRPERELFRMVVTNSFGNSELNQVRPDNAVTCIESKDIYLCLEWHPMAEKFLKFEMVAEVHESLNSLKNAKKGILLNDCLDLFTTTEQLGEHDLWFCPGCKTHQQATKKFDLWSVPEILIIHLKRFSYNRVWRDKIEGLVEFPTEGLDISRWVIGDKAVGTCYDLIAVSNHFGGLGGGHYTAYAKNKFSGKWYCFDDSSVSPMDESEAVTKAGYVLVYARRQKTVQAETDPNVEMEDVE